MANTTICKVKRQMTTGNNYLQFVVPGMIFLAPKGISQMVRKKTNDHQRKGQGYQKEKNNS